MNYLGLSGIKAQLLATKSFYICLFIHTSAAILTMNRWKSHIKLAEKNPEHINFPRQKNVLFVCMCHCAIG